MILHGLIIRLFFLLYYHLVMIMRLGQEWFFGFSRLFLSFLGWFPSFFVYRIF